MHQVRNGSTLAVVMHHICVLIDCHDVGTPLHAVLQAKYANGEDYCCLKAGLIAVHAA